MNRANGSISISTLADSSLVILDCIDQPTMRRENRSTTTARQGVYKSTGTSVCRGADRIVGYYSLAMGAVEHEMSPPRVKKGQARHPVPVMLLARLAVDREEQRAGLGRALLKDALLRTLQAADIAGIRALLVHAKDYEARAWYESFGFEPSPTDPFHLFLLMKDLRSLVQE